MRKCFYILIYLSLLAAVGCARGVDRRLVLADTLMWTAPDSSLAILNAGDTKLQPYKIDVVFISLTKSLLFRIKFVYTYDI